MKIIKLSKHNIDYQIDKDLFNIDFIVDDRINNKTKKRQFLIKWSGYSHDENTWENADIITDKKIIQRYERRKAGKQSQYDELNSYIYMISTTI